MNSLEDKHITTETVWIGLKAYSFEITGDSITRYGINTQETSRGTLVKARFEPVFGCLYLAHLLKDGEVKEAIAMYYMGEEEKKKYEEAPSLEKVLGALEKQLSLLMDGEYDAYYEDCKIRHGGGETDSRPFHELGYEMPMQDIFWNVLDLKEGRYHRSGNIRYEGRRGIPKIETIGERLYAELLDLIWKMDNENLKKPSE